MHGPCLPISACCCLLLGCYAVPGEPVFRPVCEPVRVPLAAPGSRSVHLPDEAGGAGVTAPIACTVQDYVCRPPETREEEQASVQFRVYRLCSEPGRAAFSFTVCCPMTTESGRASGKLATLRVLRGTDGGNYLLWLWGGRDLYVVEMGAGNNGAEVLHGFAAALLGLGAKGVRPEQVDASLPFAGRDPVGVIDLRDVLTEEAARRNSTAWGAVIVVPFEITGREPDEFTLRAGGGLKHGIFTFKGRGEEWRLTAAELYDDAAVWGHLH